MEDTLKKVIIIGETKDSEPLIKYLSHRTDVQFYICDIFENKDDMEEYMTFPISRMSEMERDCVIITARSNAKSIRKVLTEEYGVSDDEILEFWKMYNAYVPLMVCDRIMLNPKHSSYDGLICGLSRTEVGILTEKLGGKDTVFCNLSVSSQDLYFQYKTIEYCAKKYPNKLKNLKYAVIETYDYNYFNFDTSKGKAALEYLGWGGYNIEPHNFNDNGRYNFTFDQAMQSIINEKYGSISEKNIAMWEEFCRDVFAYNDFDGFNANFDVKKRTTIVTDEQIDGFLYNRAVLVKFFPETIKENISMLGKIMELLKGINPEMKIYTLIIPKYRETQRRDEERMQAHKKYFNEAIEDLKKMYGFVHLDFSDHEISDHRNYYYDATHLNLFGADVFTEILNKTIFGV